jgi:hypothetical protein
MKHKNKNKSVETRGVGRPAATINYPNRKFTFQDLIAENTHVTPLCLRLHLKSDAKLGKKSLIVKLDEKRPTPTGLGRKLEVYQKRSRQGIGSVAKTVKPKKAKKTVAVEVLKVESAPVAVPTPTPVEAPPVAA